MKLWSKTDIWLFSLQGLWSVPTALNSSLGVNDQDSTPGSFVVSIVNGQDIVLVYNFDVGTIGIPTDIWL